MTKEDAIKDFETEIERCKKQLKADLPGICVEELEYLTRIVERNTMAVIALTFSQDV